VPTTPLIDQHGRAVELTSWRGRSVLLVPFALEQSLRADRAASNVQIVVLSGNLSRDTPGRTAAYAKLTGATWELVTEPPGELRRLAKFFGFYCQKVPEGDPDARDKFLDALARQHLKQAPRPDGTSADALEALAVSVGRPLPPSSS
jgi:cytochrome oxidase Cu insertion factor (SCO1/SenC/PrrC family)